MLQKLFSNLLTGYTGDRAVVDRFWHELVLHYNGKKRYYHNLTHIEHVYMNLVPFFNTAIPPEVMFAMFYHDAVYDVTRKDNEEQSTDLAHKVMTEIGVPAAIIFETESLILATKVHEPTEDNTMNAFTDADLCILGAGEKEYNAYLQNIRKEFSVYPDRLYNAGRKNVLQDFLEMPRIFKTDWFYNLYERQARLNLKREHSLLG